MLIENLYDRAINRRINPAVVVSEMQDDFIKQEIDEYIFTDDITKNIYKFLKAVCDKREGKTGVWISGYYGSGKSHFIKYLFYCLNKKYRELAFKNFLLASQQVNPLDEPNENLVRLLEKSLNRLSVDEIIFNIDTYSDQNDSKDRITRVLLNRLNAFQGFNDSNIAMALYLEKPLQKQGFFEDFKKEVKEEFNENWEGNQKRFAIRSLGRIIKIAQHFDSTIDTSSLENAIKNQNQDYTIDFFIQELQDYLRDKDQSYRLIFLIDEVSQYIGSNTSLLLNLQTIVEEIGARIGPQVWIVCTAQQDLSNLISNTDSKTEDFGKILGRFETLISLQSQDAAYITKKRVLDKTSAATGLLQNYYKENKGAIENQFVFDHDLYNNFDNREDFILTYPFVPYQFRLISDVFQSFSNVGYVGEGVKNTERAILGITHFTANLDQCKKQEVGYFVPFDLFFNQQLQNNLTHLAREIINRAYQIEEVKNEAFNQRVVNALFMIANLSESYSINFPANVENLALLLMDSLHTTKIDMQTRIQAILNKLVDKNIIQVSEGKYRFLREDEIEVANYIHHTSITTEDRLKYFYEEIIAKVVQPDPNFNFNGRGFKPAIQIDEKEIGSKGDFVLKFSVYDHSELLSLAHTTPSNDLVIGLHDWIQSDDDFKKKFAEFVRTQKYIREHNASASGIRKETLDNFGRVNRLLLEEIKLRFTKKFMATAIISKNRVIPPEDLAGATPTARFKEMVIRHLTEVYHKQELSKNYATTNAELLEKARSSQKSIDSSLTPAEEEVNNRIFREGDSSVVSDLVKAFERAPFGWKDISTLDILLSLIQKGVRRIEWRSQEINLIEFTHKALNSSERTSLIIHKEKAHSQAEINEFIQVINQEIFAENILQPTNDFKEVIDSFRSKLESKLTKVHELKETYESYPFAAHFRDYHASLQAIHDTRSPEQLRDLVMTHKNDLKNKRDIFMYAQEFTEHNFSLYESIVLYVKEQKSNFHSLENVPAAKQLLEYIEQDREPWDRFPQMKKAHREVSAALDAQRESLKQEILVKYEEIFTQVDERRQELKIDVPHLTPDGDMYLNRIRKEQRLTELENYKFKADNFRAENFKTLEEYQDRQKAKQAGQTYVTSLDVSLAAEMPPTTIENADQLDAYLTKLRNQLMIKLSKNKKLFLK